MTQDDASVASWRATLADGYFDKHPRYRRDPCALYADDTYFPVVSTEADVLDVGVGYGRLLRTLVPRVGRAVGIDVSDHYFGRCRELCGDAVELRVYDGQTIPSDLGRFGFVYSISVLQHLPKGLTRAILRSIPAVLADGGVALLQFLCGPPLDRPLPSGIYRISGSAEPSVRWRVDEIEEAHGEAGLRIRSTAWGPHDKYRPHRRYRLYVLSGVEP